MSTAPSPLLQDLRSAEDELARLRGRIREVAAFIHDGAYDLAARRALAQRLDLPEPAPSTTGPEKTGGLPDGLRHDALPASSRCPV
jgi:hypothetical protein